MKIFSLFLALLLWSGAAQVPQIPSDREEPAVSAGEAAVEAITVEEAAQCLQVELDTTYKGQFEGFLDFYDNMTLEEAQAQYDANLEGEAQFFFYWLGPQDPESMDGDVIEPSPEQLARARALYREAYAQSDYTVLSAEKTEEGVFALKVQIRPLDLYVRLDERFDGHLTSFWDEIDQLDLDAMSDEEFLAWYGEAFAPRYYDACLDLLEACTPDLGHLPERTLTVTLRQEADGSLHFYDTDWQAIDNQIMKYDI